MWIDESHRCPALLIEKWQEKGREGDSHLSPKMTDPALLYLNEKKGVGFARGAQRSNFTSGV